MKIKAGLCRINKAGRVRYLENFLSFRHVRLMKMAEKSLSGSRGGQEPARVRIRKWSSGALRAANERRHTLTCPQVSSAAAPSLSLSPLSSWLLPKHTTSTGVMSHSVAHNRDDLLRVCVCVCEPTWL